LYRWKPFNQTALLFIWMFSIIPSGAVAARPLLADGSWKFSASGMTERVMMNRVSRKQIGLESSMTRFSNPSFGVGLRTKIMSQSRPEGPGYGSLTVMPHLSLFAENPKIWPVLVNIGPSYYYQFDGGRHSHYQRGWFVDIGVYGIIQNRFALVPKYRFHKHPNASIRDRKYILLEFAFLTDWR